MSDFYSRLSDTAAKLISRFGQEVTVSRVVGASGPRGGAATIVEFVTSGIRSEYETSLVDGSIIKVGDFMLTVKGAGADLEPEPGDFVEVEGVKYSVVSSSPLKPSKTALYYNLQVRKT